MEHQDPQQHKANRLAFHWFKGMYYRLKTKMRNRHMEHQKHQLTQDGTPKPAPAQGVCGSVPLVQECALYSKKSNSK